MLFETFKLRDVDLSNRTVMAPLTRSRATENNTANSLMAEYYAQRATAGLIITEGTSPSPNGLGYARIPALYEDDHVKGWKLVTDAVHAKGGKIVVQLMHTGRVSHQENLPEGAEVLSSYAEVCPGEIWTDSMGNLPHTLPRAMNTADIDAAVAEYAAAAVLAMKAGFDGVELHAANGYLIEQFLNANVNRRDDAYGGSAERRNRFLLEVTRATIKEIGANRVGVRLSPYGVVNSTGIYDGIDDQYIPLVKELSGLGLMYIHVLDHAAMGAPAVPSELKTALRAAFNGPFILAGGFDKMSAEQALVSGQADLIAMGRPFLANPDLVARLQQDQELNKPDPSTFYTPGPRGYTDYSLKG